MRTRSLSWTSPAPTVESDCDIIIGMLHDQDRAAVGIDFGTTNSSIALASADGADSAPFLLLPWRTDQASRSVLYLEQLQSASGAKRLHRL